VDPTSTHTLGRPPIPGEGEGGGPCFGGGGHQVPVSSPSPVHSSSCLTERSAECFFVNRLWFVCWWVMWPHQGGVLSAVTHQPGQLVATGTQQALWASSLCAVANSPLHPPGYTAGHPYPMHTHALCVSCLCVAARLVRVCATSASWTSLTCLSRAASLQHCRSHHQQHPRPHSSSYSYSPRRRRRSYSRQPSSSSRHKLSRPSRRRQVRSKPV